MRATGALQGSAMTSFLLTCGSIVRATLAMGSEGSAPIVAAVCFRPRFPLPAALRVGEQREAFFIDELGHLAYRRHAT